MPARGDGRARVFAALGQPERLRLVARLGECGPLSISQLAAGASISRQAVSKHLRVMERAGLARCARRGRESVWRLERRPLDAARQYLAAVERQWEGALERLRRWVEASV